MVGDPRSGLSRPVSIVLVSLLTAACGRSGGVPAVLQTLPETDVYLVLVHVGSGGNVVGIPRNVTKREGYDNQPLFLPDGSAFFFTSFHDGQTDIYRYNIETGTVERVTATPAGEWAPALVPDGGGFTISRAEDGEAFQRLWRFPMDGRSPRVVLRDVTGAGYHAWVDADTVALYLTADPSELALVDVASGHREVVAVNVGRCIHVAGAGRALLYVDKSDPDQWLIRELDISIMEAVRRVPAIASNEDFAVHRDRSLLMGDGRRLMVHRPGSASWELLADWTEDIPGEITRIAVSPRGRYLAIVVKES